MDVHHAAHAGHCTVRPQCSLDKSWQPTCTLSDIGCHYGHWFDTCHVKWFKFIIWMAPCNNLLSVCFIGLRKKTSNFRLNIYFPLRANISIIMVNNINYHLIASKTIAAIILLKIMDINWISVKKWLRILLSEYFFTFNINTVDICKIMGAYHFWFVILLFVRTW